MNPSKLSPFNNDPFLHAEVARLIGKWGAEVAFETGTYHGHTTLALSLLCPRTFTAEIDANNFSHACELFDQVYEHGNIEANQGTSPEVLKQNLPEVSGARTLFYLDAHWESYWPLLDEAKMIAQQDAPPPVIVIHDFEVPERPDLGFDSYN
ncbi:MAG: putative O-methyltransferase YrrM [Akkermansiaceae bacterium]|jgi:predicted O-methyltransferase YrrM